MKFEIEAKFLNVNHKDIRQRLIKLNGKCEQPMRLLRRVTIETPELVKKNAFLRIRDEGHRVTLTYKQFDLLSVDGAREVEVEVSHFEDTIALLAAAGLSYQSYQESKRETWTLNNCEVVLDEWPWLKSYIEIEGANKEEVQRVAERLGFSWNNAVFGDVMVAYRAEYPHLTLTDKISRLTEVKFGDPLPKFLQT